MSWYDNPTIQGYSQPTGPVQETIKQQATNLVKLLLKRNKVDTIIFQEPPLLC